MTNQQNGAGPHDTADLQPLKFLRMSDDGIQAVYQAHIDNPDAEYTLTVTTASPGSDQERQQIKQFLADMVASFQLTQPLPDGKPEHIQQPEPFDLSTGILIEPDLIKAKTGTGPFGIAMTLQTTVGPEDGEPPSLGVFAIRGIVLAGKNHIYRARHGSATATVTGLGGRGRISSPNKDVVTGGPSQSDSGPTVTVHGYTRFVYNLSGNFF